jgi:hypothetical protein
MGEREAKNPLSQFVRTIENSDRADLGLLAAQTFSYQNPGRNHKGEYLKFAIMALGVGTTSRWRPQPASFY